MFRILHLHFTVYGNRNTVANNLVLMVNFFNISDKIYSTNICRESLADRPATQTVGAVARTEI